MDVSFALGSFFVGIFCGLSYQNNYINAGLYSLMISVPDGHLGAVAPDTICFRFPRQHLASAAVAPEMGTAGEFGYGFLCGVHLALLHLRMGVFVSL